MRGRGTAFLYVVVLLVGAGLVALFLGLLASGQAGWPQIFGTWIIGAICAVYSIRQLLRPVPIRIDDDEDEDDDQDDEDRRYRNRRR
jgi:hypothetical protein